MGVPWCGGGGVVWCRQPPELYRRMVKIEGMVDKEVRDDKEAREENEDSDDAQDKEDREDREDSEDEENGRGGRDNESIKSHGDKGITSDCASGGFVGDGGLNKRVCVCVLRAVWGRKGGGGGVMGVGGSVVGGMGSRWSAISVLTS